MHSLLGLLVRLEMEPLRPRVRVRLVVLELLLPARVRLVVLGLLPLVRDPPQALAAKVVVRRRRLVLGRLLTVLVRLRRFASPFKA